MRDNGTLETHECVLEIIFNRVTKSSTCCLSLIVTYHLDDDFFVTLCNYSQLSVLPRQRHMTFFVWPTIFLFFFFFSWPQEEKSQVLASCAQWSISRSGKPSFISLTNSGPFSFLLCRRVPIARFRKSASGRKKWPTLSSWDMSILVSRI